MTASPPRPAARTSNRAAAAGRRAAARATPPRAAGLSGSTRALCVGLLLAAGLIGVRACTADGAADAAAPRSRRAVQPVRADLRARLVASALGRLGRIDLGRVPTAAPRVALGGVVLDPDGVPLAGVRVELDLAGDLIGEGAAASTTTDGDGRFAIPVELAFGGWVSGFVVARHGELIGAAPLQVAHPGPNPDLEVTLGHALAIDGRVEVGGVARAGVEVVAARVGALDGRVLPDARAVSGDDGRFALAVLGPGAYRLQARVGAARPAEDRWAQVLVGAPPPEVAIAIPAVTEVALVARSRAGVPVAGARIVDGNSQDRIAITDRDGVARFMTDRAEQAYVRLDADGFASQGIAVPAGDVEVVLDAVGGITGEVVAEFDGVAVVEARLVGEAYGVTTRMTQPGRFRLDLQPGDYEVIARVEGAGDSQPLATTVRLGETHDLGRIAVADRAGSLNGAVVDGRGEPVAEARVVFNRAGDWRPAGALTDEHGRFELARIPAGTYQAEAWIGDERVTAEVTVTAGQAAEVELVPTYDRSGEVVAASGEAGEDDDEYGDEYGDDEHVDEHDGDDGEDDDYDDHDDEYQASFEPDLTTMWTDAGLIVLGRPSAAADDATIDLGGLLPGDLIERIDGRAFDADAASLVGKPGTVRVRILRPATGKRFEVELPRDREYYEEGGC